MSLRKICLLTLASTLLMSAAFAQPNAPDTLWTRLYSAGSMDTPWDVSRTSDGGVVICSQVFDPPFTRSDAVVRKLDVDGNELWIRRLTDAHESYEPLRIITATDSSTVVAGESGFGPFVSCFSADGDSLWTTYFSLDMWEAITGLMELPDGSFLMMAPFDTTDQWCAGVAAISRTGDSLWTRTYPAPRGRIVYPQRILPTPDGGYIILGRSQQNIPPGPYGLYSLKATAAGDTVWTHDMLSSEWPFMGALYYTSPSDFIFGSRWGDRNLLIKMNLHGDTVWTRDYQANDHFATAIGVTPGRNQTLIAGGNSIYPDVGTIGRLDSAGNILWVSDLRVRGMWLMVLTAFELSSGGFNMVFSASDENGNNFIGVARYAADTLRADPQATVQPDRILLKPCYPNPFNASTEITFDLPRTERATVTVYDILGQKVAVLTDGMTLSGEHRLTFDASDLPSGVYFYRLQAETESQTRKMLLLK